MSFFSEEITELGKAMGAERFGEASAASERIDRAAAALRAQGGDGALLDAAGVKRKGKRRAKEKR